MFIHRLKLRAPEVASSWVERPALEAALDDAIRVAAIVAGPGYGKTTLAARMAARRHGPVLWYSLDASDADLAVFAAHLDAAISSWDVGPTERRSEELALLKTPKEVGSFYAEQVARADAPLLVFDDVHAIDGSRALEALAELIERGHALDARFVVTGRTMPLPLHRFALSGRLATIGADDLTLAPEDVRAFLGRALPTGSPDAAVSGLAALTGGWPAGVALVAFGARSRVKPSAGPDGSTDTDEARRIMFDYLAAEVLDTLAPAERSFLLRSAILDGLETQLCDEVLGIRDAGALLDSLSRRGLFVVRTAPDSFACQPLFREFLRLMMTRDVPASEIAALHVRAAAAYAARGAHILSIGHLADAGELDAAQVALERDGVSLLRAGLVSAVAGSLRRLGPERVDASGALLCQYGFVQRERGEWDAALVSLNRAADAARRNEDYNLLADVVRVWSPIMAARNDLAELQRMASEVLAHADDLTSVSAAGLRSLLAAVQIDADQLDDALEMYREITPELVAAGNLEALGPVLHNVGVAQVRKGDVYAGLSTYERALKVKEQVGRRLSLLHTLGDIIYVKTLLGDTDEGQRLGQQFLEAATDVGASALIARAYEQLGAVALARDDVDAALAHLARAEAMCDPGDVVLLPEVEHGLAKALRRKGAIAEAESKAERAASILRASGKRQLLGLVQMTQAACALDRADVRSAAERAVEGLDDVRQGPSALVRALGCITGAALLARCAAAGGAADAHALDDLARRAAVDAVALIHQRDYRFLLRTQRDIFESLTSHFARWGIGRGLLGDLPAARAADALRIEFFGGFRVYADGMLVEIDTWKRRRAPQVFAFLVSHRGQPVPRDRFVDVFWPDSEADAAHDNLRVTMTSIRKAVGDVVKYDANAYRFVPPAGTFIDVDAFDAGGERGRQADAAGSTRDAHDAFTAAVELYRGDYLDGMPDAGWQWRDRERLRAAALDALRWLAREARAAGDHASLVRATDRLLAVAPFDLDAVKMRFDALAAERRMDEATREYAAWRERYRLSVGVDPPDVWQPDDARRVTVLRSARRSR